MSSPSGQINYARETGIHSLAAAVIFAVLYAILLPYYIFRAIRNPTYVLIILSLFCAIRVTAFVIRAILAGSDSAGTNVGLVIGETIVYSVGFFGLLYSAYTLVLDREQLSGVVSRSPISRITSNRRLIRVALLAAVAVGITGSTYLSSNNPSDQNNAKTLRRVSSIIFLVVAALLALHTLLLVRQGGAASRRAVSHGASVGTAHGMHILGVIVILLLVREVYLTVRINTIVQDEPVWYPLAVLPELLVVLLFAVPSLVPEKKDLLASQNQFGKYPEETTEMA